MNKDYWAKWAKAAAVRAIKTFGQSAVAAVGTTAIGITQMDVLAVLSVGLGGAFCSILTSLAGLPELE